MAKAKNKKPISKTMKAKPTKAGKTAKKAGKSTAKAMAPKAAKKAKTSVKAASKTAPKKTKVAAKPTSAKKAGAAAKGKGKAGNPAPMAKVGKTSVPAKPRKIDFSDFITPLDDRVLVRLNGTERKTAGGLFIPDTVSDVSGNLQGMVVALGRGHRDKKGRLRPLDLALGDSIVFAQYAGSKIRLHDEELVLLRESEVMGVIS